MHSRTKSRIRLLGEGGTMSVAMKIEVNFFENVSENIREKNYFTIASTGVVIRKQLIKMMR